MLNFNRIKGFLMVEKGIGEVCADGYIGAIKRYVKETKDEDIDKDKAVEYIMGFHKKHKSYSHIVNTSLSLERFSEFLEKPFKVGRPRKPKRIIRDFLSETEIARMFSFTTGIRQKAILAVLAYSGIRNNELCNLSIKDYDFSENMILVRGGKGMKDGKICVAQECTEIVLEYIKKYPRKEDDMLFESMYGGNLKTSAVRKHIKTIVKNAKITKRAYPHLLRHSLAINMLLRGADFFTIKEQLRHSQIETTLIYLRSHPRILQNRYQAFCPAYNWCYQFNPMNTINNQYHNQKKSVEF